MNVASEGSAFQFEAAVASRQMLPTCQRDVAKSPSDVAISAQDVANLHARLATCRGAVKYANRILCHLSLFLSLNCAEMATWCLSVSSVNHSIKTIAIQNNLL
jgi:hypothetical protein